MAKIVLQDSREKRKHHDNILHGLTERGVKVERTKLYVGDYTLPTNQSVCVDVKAGLGEVYSNIISDHARFIRECRRAQESGIHLIVLVEQKGIGTVLDVAMWKNPRISAWTRLRDAHRQNKRMNEPLNPYPPVSSERLAKAMQTISDRYGVEWRFCDKAETAKKICELLGLEVENG